MGVRGNSLSVRLVWICLNITTTMSYSKIVNSGIMKRDWIEYGNGGYYYFELLLLFELLQRSIAEIKLLVLKNKNLKLGSMKNSLIYLLDSLLAILYSNNIDLLLSTVGTKLGTWHVLPFIFINIILNIKCYIPHFKVTKTLLRIIPLVINEPEFEVRSVCLPNVHFSPLSCTGEGAAWWEVGPWLSPCVNHRVSWANYGVLNKKKRVFC